MKYFAFIICLFSLLSCSRNGTLDKYYQIVDSADKIIYYNKVNETFEIDRESITTEHLQTSKNILKRNIKVQKQKRLIAKHKIELYKENKVVAIFLIEDFVNFESPDLKFGFPLTYGIGMSL